MRFWLALIGTMVLGTALQAQSVALRSAEHDGFTRVVFDTAQPEAIRLEQIGARIVARLPAGAGAVSDAGFFDRITRSRVSALSIDPGEGQVSLQLACRCAFKSTQVSGRMLILDIFDAKSSDNDSASDGLAAIPAFPGRVPRSLSFGAAQGEARVSGSRFAHSVPLRFGKLAALPGSAEMDSGKAPAETTAAQSIGKDALTQRLLAQLDASTAARESTVGLQVPPDDDVADQMLFRSLAKVQSRALPEVESALAATIENCEQAHMLDPLTWPDPQEPARELAALRRSLAQDNGALSDGGRRALALTYLSLAMGAEARSVFDDLRSKAAADEALMALGLIIDGDSPSSDLPGAATANCEATRVWQVLAQRPLDKTSLDAARQAFDQWPKALQGVFAAEFAKRLNAVREPDGAALALRRAGAAPERRGGERDVVQAEILETLEDHDAANALRKQLIERDAPTAPEAAVALAENDRTSLTQLRELSEGALTSYREELDGTELESALMRANITALLRAEDFASALDAFDAYSEQVRRTQSDMVLDEIAAQLLEIDSDASFLREAVSIKPEYFRRLGADLQSAMKSRVTQLGFADLASQLGLPRELGEGADTAAAAQTLAIESGDELDGSEAARDRDEGRTRGEVQLARPAPVAGGGATPASAVEPELRAAQAPDGGRGPQVAPNLPTRVAEAEAVLAGLENLREELAALGLKPAAAPVE